MWLVAIVLDTAGLDHQCPTVFFRLPQLWRINLGIRHFTYYSIPANFKKINFLYHFPMT